MTDEATELRLHFEHMPWVQMNYLLQRANHEIGFFAISHEDNPLKIIQLYMPVQECSSAFVRFDEDDISKYMDDMSQIVVNEKTKECMNPNRYWRIWIHTHPNMSPNPSGTDTETFADTFNECAWAVMFIIAKNRQTFARIRTVCKQIHPILGEQSVAMSNDLKVVYDPLEHLGLANVNYPLAEWDALLKEKCSPMTYPQHYGHQGSDPRKWQGGTARGRAGFHGSQQQQGKGSQLQLPSGEGGGADNGALFREEQEQEGEAYGSVPPSDIVSFNKEATEDEQEEQIEALQATYEDVPIRSAICIQSAIDELNTLTDLELEIVLREIIDDHGADFFFDLLDDITKPQKETAK